jgi:predicted chitinase
LAIDNPYATAWAYLPGPIVEDGSPVDGAEVLARAAGLSVGRAREILPTLREGLRLSECTTERRIAMWLAQVGHESDSFNATEEYAKNGRYAPYIGRTWIQITWESNYADFGRWCWTKKLVDDPHIFENNPSELADLKWAGIGPAWYWTVQRPDINALSDRSDLETVTYRINGGDNGIADRRARYNRALSVGAELLSLTIGDDDMANVPQEQWDRVYKELTQPHRSRSPLRHLGEKEIDTWAGIDLNDDANDHVVSQILLAIIGDSRALALLAEVAGADPVKYPDRQDDAALARRILQHIESTNPTVLEQFIAKKGISA